MKDPMKTLEKQNEKIKKLVKQTESLSCEVVYLVLEKEMSRPNGKESLKALMKVVENRQTENK